MVHHHPECGKTVAPRPPAASPAGGGRGGYPYIPHCAKDSLVLKHLYHVRVSNGEDGYLVAQCVELPAAIAQGKTKEEVLENITEAIELVLADMHAEILEKDPVLVEA